MNQDTDSDVAELKDGGKAKLKWTQEEVIAYRLLLALASRDTNLNISMFPG